MKLIIELKKIDKKIKKITHIGFIACLLMSLLATMILSIYHSTYILFQFNLGITLLKLSVFFFVAFAICSIAFDKIIKDIS